MIIILKPTAVEVKTTTCEFHKLHPNEQYAGCTCSSCYSVKEVKTEEQLVKEWIERMSKSRAWRIAYGDGADRRYCETLNDLGIPE